MFRLGKWLVAPALAAWLGVPAGAQVACPTLVASPDPSYPGDSVTVSVVGALPGATVTFIIDGVSQPPVTVAAGQPQLTISTLSLGTHTITGNVNGCAPSLTLTVNAPPNIQFRQQGPKLVGSGASSGAGQGSSVALSADGSTALVGGPGDDGIWVFSRSSGVWSQQGGKLAGTGEAGNSAGQGAAVALSADGNTALVGGPEDNGGMGAVWVFTRTAGVWNQQGEKLVGSGSVGTSSQGTSIALSSDGNTAIVGGPGDNSHLGATWVFTRSGGVWSQQGGKLVGSGSTPGDSGAVAQGASVALSAGGNTALIAGPDDNDATGAVWAFTRSGSVWSQQGSKLVGSGAGVSPMQGGAVALSADGDTALVGGRDAGNPGRNAVWEFTRLGGVWSQQGNPFVSTAVGHLALSADGHTVVFGAPFDLLCADRDAAAFTVSGSAWGQLGSGFAGTGVAPGVHQPGACQGEAVALSADGATALIGAPGDHNTLLATNVGVGAAWVFSTLPPTSTVLTASPNPSVQGQRVTLTAAVTAGATGAVVFSVDGVEYPAVALNGGQAQIATIDLSLGTHTITATYSGDANFLGSTSNTLSQTVTLMPSTTSLSASPNPSVYGQGVTFTAAVTDGATGTVIFSIDGTPQPPIAVSGGRAQFTISNLALGSHTISAAYSGDARFMSSISSHLTQAVTPAPTSPPTPLSFVPVTPCRVADTRLAPVGPLAGPSLAGGTSRDFPVPSSACRIPATAAAYALNVTAVPHGGLSYLSIWPAGVAQPPVSTLNSFDGRIKANAAVVPAAGNGAVSVFVTDPADVVLDVTGYFVAAGTEATALSFYPLAPCRLADTRNPNGSLGGPFLSAQSSRAFPVLAATACPIPATAQAYSLNVTALPRTRALEYLSVWPAGQPQPAVSTLNAGTGTYTANATIVQTGAGGQIEVYATDDTDLLLDINGYFAPPGAGGLSLYTVTPCRVLDTRSAAGAPPFSGPKNVSVVGSPCGAPLTAQGYVLNATAVPAGALNFLALWPQGQAQPPVSTLNAVDSAVTSNLAIVPTSNGSISAFASGEMQLLLDISGYFAP
ncbi:MAG: Ig-like domain-containing protein [Acidobacteriia bacterium]|nr:Ig-like domain-containing protein [Terriglobia bacterium]